MHETRLPVLYFMLRDDKVLNLQKLSVSYHRKDIIECTERVIAHNASTICLPHLRPETDGSEDKACEMVR